MDGSKRRKSAVWDYFTQPIPGKAVCNTCKEHVSMGGGTNAKTFNTSNLWSHLRIHHSDLYATAQLQLENATSSQAETTTLSQPKIQDLFQKQRKWPNSDQRSKLIDKLITEMIITDNQPFTVVSDIGFKRLIGVAAPQYSLKNEKYYRTEMLPEVHHKVVEKVKALINPENAGNALSFTTDCWSGTTEALMSLTCHFIDKNWIRKQVVLNTKAMHGSHTGEYISQTFLGMLQDWNISKDRVTLVLRDSGANMVKGMRLAELPDLSCTAHSLQLVVHDGLSSQRAVTDVIAIIRKCATHFHHSVLAKQRLRVIQKDLGLPQHNIIQAVPTRWNSTLHMLQRALEQKRALNIYAGEHGGFACPTAYQWDIVSSLVETLIPIEEVTLEVSSNSASASCIIPSVAVLKMLLQDDGASTKGIGTLREAMRESLIKRFSKLEDLKPVVLACLLDPRYKNHAFSSAITLSKAKEWLKEEVESATKQSTQEEHDVTEETSVKATAAEVVNDEEQAPAEESGTQESDIRTTRGQRRGKTSCTRRIDDMFSSLLGPHAGEPMAEACLEDELQLYLREPVIDRRKGDPLQWWKQNEVRYKLLATQARRFLCSPPSSVPSERVFSEVSAIYERNRSRLTGHHAEQLCFLHYNLVLLDWDY
ncbi:zinc finger BED domain-containing protein 4-like [Salarias fasciatus]|uniref:zinc finger BED domain-containing protein 4-like n=1 Tax=Salarias fasciatus TaxID=181472 RepID=UPI0011766A39|nr:zinc finger BED domain-containing protein 4-like [Salarias fasciatus]